MFSSIVESVEFQNKYKKYMDVQEDRIYSNLVENLEVVSNDVYKTIGVLEDCVKLMGVDADVLTEAGPTNSLKDIQSFIDDPSKMMGGYKAVQTDIEKTVSWSDEKGIVNKIIAFVKGIVKWLWSLVKTVFKGFKNFLVRVFGGKPLDETKSKIIKLSDALKRVTKESIDTVELIDSGNKKNQRFSVYKLASDGAIGAITESVLNEVETVRTRDPEAMPPKGEEAEKDKNNYNKKPDFNKRMNNTAYEARRQNSPTLVVFDLKNEIYSLKQLVDHFLNIYDTAYGSNNENLFGVDDLEVILNLFVNTLNDLKSGTVRSYEGKAGYMEIRPIDANAVRANLLTTNANLTKLKDVFSQTHAGIQSIARLLNAKQMQALAASPQIYKFLSMETYGQMSEMLDVIEPRFNDAKEMEQQLNIAKKKFEAVAAELERLSPALTTLGNLSYVPEQQKRVLNLLNSAKYMTQTVNLRLSSIALYLRDLEEIKSLLVALSAGGKEFAREFRLPR